MQWWRRVRWVFGLAATLLVFGLLVPASPAYAHATLIDSDPINGAGLGESPEEIRLRFTERVTVAPDGVRLQDADGRQVDTDPPTVPADDPTAVVLPVPTELPEGSYVVTFRIVSADSHPVSGAIVFGVGVAAGSLGDVDLDPEDGAVSGVFTAARWTGYAGLALLAGALWVLVFCWPEGWTNPRARRLVLTGLAASLAAGVAVLLLQGPYTSGRSLAGLFDPELLSITLGTEYGGFVLARLGLVVLAGAVVLTGQRWPARVRAAGAVTVGVALPFTWVGTGHTNTAGPVDLVADVVHLTAMAGWFGGLAVLAVCLLPGAASVPADQAGPALRRFSLLASGAVAVIVVTGVYLAWQRVGTWDALFGTAYGRLLAFKIAVLGVLLWLGSLSRAVVKRRETAEAAALTAGRPGSGKATRAAEQVDRESRSRLRQSVRLEVVTAVAVLVVASLLVATPPGVVVTTAEAQAAAPSGPVLDEIPLDDETGVLVLVDPARPGENRVILEVVDPFGEPREVPEVRASFVLAEQDLGPLPVEFTETAPGVHEASDFVLPVPGEWQLSVTVRTTEIDSTTVQVEVPVS